MGNEIINITDENNPAIYIQSICMEDINDTYVNWLNDPQVNQYLETRFSHQTVDSVTSFVQNIIINPNEYLFTIRTRDNCHIGNIKVGAINTHHATGEVSLFIGDKNSWGKGYATLAIRLISHFAFSTLKIRKLSAGAYQSNIASTKAFIKAGYKMDGIKKDHCLSNNEIVDAVYVCLFSHQAKILNSIAIENKS